MWRPAHSIVRLRAELDVAFPDRVRPDWLLGDPAHAHRRSDHNPNEAGVVCAIDIRGADTATAVWGHLLATRDRRIKYMIHDSRIASARGGPWASRPYFGANPHRDHLHLSVGVGPDGRSTGPYDDGSPWGFAPVATPPVPVPPPPQGDEMSPAPPTVRHGDNGQAVRNLQGLMHAVGRPLTVDGEFGPRTHATLSAWQADAGLTADGICGPRTWSHLCLTRFAGA